MGMDLRGFAEVMDIEGPVDVNTFHPGESSPGCGMAVCKRVREVESPAPPTHSRHARILPDPCLRAVGFEFPGD
jgi:hypothetical protein